MQSPGAAMAGLNVLVGTGGGNMGGGTGGATPRKRSANLLPARCKRFAAKQTKAALVKEMSLTLIWRP